MMALGVFILFATMLLSLYAIYKHEYNEELYVITAALFSFGFFIICWDCIAQSLR